MTKSRNARHRWKCVYAHVGAAASYLTSTGTLCHIDLCAVGRTDGNGRVAIPFVGAMKTVAYTALQQHRFILIPDAFSAWLAR